MDGVSLQHYAGLNGFGTGFSPGDLGNLLKALEAGTAIVNQQGGAALRVQSLEESLKVLSFRAKNLTMWRKIPKSPAYSTAEEYNQLVAYGTPRREFFTREGELGPTSDSDFRRRVAYVKYLSEVRSVTLQMMQVNPAHGDVVTLYTRMAIMDILGRTEQYMYTADSSLSFVPGTSEQFDGFDAMIDPALFIDMEGASLQESDIEEGASLILKNYGYPTDMFNAVKAQSDLTKTMYPRERVPLPAPTQGGRVGFAVQGMMTTGGDIEFNPDVFIDQIAGVTNIPPTAATDARAPATPVTIAQNGANSGADGQFAKSQGTASADYQYVATTCNRFGESAPRFVAAGINVSAAEVALKNHLNLIVTNPTPIGANLPEYIKIYRTVALAAGTAVSANVNDYSLVLKIPVQSQAAAGTTTVADRNFTMPFTTIAYLGEMDEDVLTFRQLAPLMKLDLAVVSPAYQWMVLLFGVPILYAPKKWMRFINIKNT